MRKALIAAQVTLALLFCDHAQAQPRSAADPEAGVAATLTAAERSQLEAIPQAFSAAWARGSGEELGALMNEDVDFITVGGLWLHGRRDFVTYHSRLLQGRFRGSTNTPLEIRVQPLRPDLAIVRWSWRIAGDRNPDGSMRPPRVGLMSMLAERQDSRWLVISSQNTNGGPGDAPERVGLKEPIRLPPNRP